MFSYLFDDTTTYGRSTVFCGGEMSQGLKENIKCQGFMHKKGGMRWQKRYFVLYQQGTRLAQLAYFRDGKSHEEDARATLELAPDTKVDTLLGRAHAFQVILKGGLETTAAIQTVL